MTWLSNIALEQPAGSIRSPRLLTAALYATCGKYGHQQ